MPGLVSFCDGMLADTKVVYKHRIGAIMSDLLAWVAANRHLPITFYRG